MAATSCLSLSYLGGEWRQRSWGFFVLTLLLVLTRIGPLPWIAGMERVGDEGAYIRTGLSLLQIISQWFAGERVDPEAVAGFYHYGWHPPLSGVLAGFAHALGGLPAARSLQALLGIAGGLYFFRLARLLLPRRAALLAYGAFALNPYLVVFSHFLWSENVYLLLSTIWLIWYFQLLEDERFGRSRAALGGVLAGLLWYAKSAFTPVWLALLLVLPFVARKRRAAAGTYLAAGLLGFVLALPWDLVIYSQEGRFAHGSTASAVHVAAKYNNLGLTSWSKTWDYTHQRAAENGGHFIDEAKQISGEYFRSLGLNPIAPLSIVARDTLQRYLLGRSFIHRHLIRGVYPTTMPALGVALLAYDNLVRFLLIGLGGLGLLLGSLSGARRLALVGFALGNAAIVLVGLPNGRHILMNYAVLTIGLAALWEGARRSRPRPLILGAAGVVLVVAAVRDLGRSTGPDWPYRFVAAAQIFGAQPQFASDILLFKPAPGCARRVPIELSPATLRRGRIQGREDQPSFKEPQSTRLVVERPWLKVQWRQPAALARRHLEFAAAGAGRYAIDLQTHSKRWEPLPGSCLLVRWEGHRLR